MKSHGIRFDKHSRRSPPQCVLPEFPQRSLPHGAGSIAPDRGRIEPSSVRLRNFPTGSLRCRETKTPRCSHSDPATGRACPRDGAIGIPPARDQCSLLRYNKKRPDGETRICFRSRSRYAPPAPPPQRKGGTTPPQYPDPSSDEDGSDPHRNLRKGFPPHNDWHHSPPYETYTDIQTSSF